MRLCEVMGGLILRLRREGEQRGNGWVEQKRGEDRY